MAIAGSIYTYTLKHENVLPTNTKYVEVWDGKSFIPKPKETLNQLYTRIKTHRESYKDAPLIQEPHFKELIVMSLAENLQPRTKTNIEKYFKIESKMPQLSKSITALKALVQEAVSPGVVPVSKRKDRTGLCLAPCPFHIHPNQSFASNLFQKAVDVVDKTKQTLSLSPSEANTFPEQDNLGVCGLCGCPLKSKIKFSVHTILPTLQPDELLQGFTNMGVNFFGKCWIIKESMGDVSLKKLLMAKIDNGSKGRLPNAANMWAKYLDNVNGTNR